MGLGRRKRSKRKRDDVSAGGGELLRGSPHKLNDGSWGVRVGGPAAASIEHGSIHEIEVVAKSGNSWTQFGRCYYVGEGRDGELVAIFTKEQFRPTRRPDGFDSDEEEDGSG